MKKINLFHPYVPVTARDAARAVLDTRWIGQGPRVDEFEEIWQDKFDSYESVAVGSGTDALHLAYILAGVQPGDEVISPVFSCAATNMPLLYIGAKPVFADINKDNLNMSIESVRSLISDKTKAIACVDYGGLPADLDGLMSFGLPLIEDSAQAHGAEYKGKKVGGIADFTAFSFQAIKLITTCDGGMLTIKEASLVDKARRIRWFGIDRKAKLNDKWENDIREIGYKYQMTDVAAAMGIEALKIFDKTQSHQREMFMTYKERLGKISGINFIGDTEDSKSSCWLATVIAEDRDGLKEKLAENEIESNQVHYRNDLYTIFGSKVDHCPNMDALEKKYLVLPMHYHLSLEDINRVCDVIEGGW